MVNDKKLIYYDLMRILAGNIFKSLRQNSGTCGLMLVPVRVALSGSMTRLLRKIPGLNKIV